METQAEKIKNWDIDNLPNRLTIFRICLIPVIIGCLSLNLFDIPWAKEYQRLLGYFSAWTFVAASITDFVDGYVARKRDIVTVFGSFLDPLADKFLVISSLIILQAIDRIPVILVLILVLREVYITGLRLLAQDTGFSVPVSKLAKWKTTLQMVGIPLLMAYDHPWGIPMPLLGNICIYTAAIFSIYSAIAYSLGLLKKIKELRKKGMVGDG
jgi:CDP-diacylglycerol--glycerol-3-phosphate 3-phosphatidyltransferase